MSSRISFQAIKDGVAASEFHPADIPPSAPSSTYLWGGQAANDPTYGADDAIDGERNGEGPGNSG